MNPDELARYRTIAEQNRRLRRYCEALKAQNEALRQKQSAESKAFDEANEEMFQAIHRNHQARGDENRGVFVCMMKKFRWG